MLQVFIPCACGERVRERRERARGNFLEEQKKNMCTMNERAGSAFQPADSNATAAPGTWTWRNSRERWLKIMSQRVRSSWHSHTAFPLAAPSFVGAPTNA